MPSLNARPENLAAHLYCVKLCLFVDIRVAYAMCCVVCCVSCGVGLCCVVYTHLFVLCLCILYLYANAYVVCASST